MVLRNKIIEASFKEVADKVKITFYFKEDQVCKLYLFIAFKHVYFR